MIFEMLVLNAWETVQESIVITRNSLEVVRTVGLTMAVLLGFLRLERSLLSPKGGKMLGKTGEIVLGLELENA